jgi:NADPH:quinone reductase-like Zn-dependent oxidoreductase
MRAYVLTSLEAGAELMDVPVPDVGPREVLVRVVSSSVNPHDGHVISGAAQAYLEYQFPITLGNDLAGVVEKVGDEVTRFRAGDKVFGLVQGPVAHRGTFAEYVALPEDQFLVAQPDNLDDVEAGALGLATIAALCCIEPLGLDAGRTLFVNGATGGVGSCVVQIAVAAGATVIATARPGAEERHVRGLGAKEVVDWSGGDVAAAVRQQHPDGVDALVDLINFDPDALTALASSVLAPNGRLASTLGAGDPDRLASFDVTNVMSSPEPTRLATMAAMAGDGSLRAKISAVYDLEAIEEAHAALAAGPLGKIAIRVS